MKQDKSEKIPIDAGDIREITGAMHDIRALNSTIGNIAAEINQLSVDAAGEAARFGEAGKNLAAAAEEIRELAVSSAEQSLAIEKVLAAINPSLERITKAAPHTLDRHRDTGSTESTVKASQPTETTSSRSPFPRITLDASPQPYITQMADFFPVRKDKKPKTPGKKLGFAARDLLSQAYAYEDEGDIDMAIAACTQVIAIEPDADIAFRRRGRLFFEKREYAKTIADYTDAIRLNPDADAYVPRGMGYAFQGEADKAISDFTEAIRLDPSNGMMALLWRGAIYHYPPKEDDQAAVADLSKVISMNSPEHTAAVAFAYKLRGDAYYFLGMYDNAIADYIEARRMSPDLDVDPDYAQALFDRGQTLFDQTLFDRKEVDRALSDFDEAIRLNPKFARPYNARGVIYLAQEQYDRAEADFNEAIRLAPDYCGAYKFRGMIFCDKKEYGPALEDFNKAIELSPDFADAFVERGIVYRLQNKHDKAIEDFTKAISLEPDNPNAFFERCITYIRIKDPESAIADFAKILQIDPDYPLGDLQGLYPLYEERYGLD
jgi:tetratricopeptide (TPR) repeat protein